MLHILQARPGLIIDVEEGTLKVSSAQLQSRVRCTMSTTNILTDFQIFYQLQHDVKLLWGRTLNMGMDTVSFCWGFYMTHSPYCLPFKHMGQKLQ